MCFYPRISWFSPKKEDIFEQKHRFLCFYKEAAPNRGHIKQNKTQTKKVQFQLFAEKMMQIRLHLGAVLALVAVSRLVSAEDLVVTPLPVSPPTATHCTVATPGPRLTVVLTEDGTIFIRGTEFSSDQLTAIASTILKIEPDTKLFLRADKTVATDHVKRVIKACGAGGMNNVIFGGLTDKDHKTLNAANKAVDSTR